MKNIRLYLLLSIVSIGASIWAQNAPAPLVRHCGYNINTGNLEIRWEPSTEVNVAYYEVRYYYPKSGNISEGWNKINGNINVGTDLFLAFDPASLVEVDYLSEPVIIGVQAYDSDGKSLNLLQETVFDSTIFLEANYDSCQATLDLSWNRYTFKQWPQPGTSEYQIFISNDGGTNYNLLASAPYTDTSFQVNNLTENNDYLIYIAALSTNTPGDVANSNTVEINSDMAILPRYITANYATNSNDNIELSFSVDPASETSIYNLLRSTAPYGIYDSIIQFIDTQKEINYTDPVNYTNGPYYYKLEVINYCGVSILESENSASSIVLEKEGDKLSPTLLWNPYINWPNGKSTYKLERRFGNSDFAEINRSNDTSYIDSELEELVENNYAAEVCYHLSAIEENGENVSLSNTICYALPPNIRFEYDAFMPGSGTENNTFGPVIDFLPDEYIFQVIERSGRKVYESKDPENTRWDGTINGKLAPEGVYMCIVQYRIGSEKKQTIHGAVVVVYE